MQSSESLASPIPLSPLTRFREYLGQDRLAYQYDAAARRAVFYPRVAGPGTGNCELDWRVSAGVGTVYAVTVVAPRGEPVYNVVLVDMDEGFRLMSRVEGIDADKVRIGMRVRFRTHRPDADTHPYPVFDEDHQS